MTLRSTLLSLAVAGAFAAPFTALGQSGTTQLSEGDFSRFDTNRDNYVSLAEWRRANLGQTQGQMQQGQRQGQQAMQGGQQIPGQGVVIVTLTPIEEQMIGEQRRESLFRALDANGNGYISPVEAGLNMELLTAFTQLDRDNNGIISREEFTNVHVQEGQAQQQGRQGLAQQRQQGFQQGYAGAGGTAQQQQRRQQGQQGWQQEQQRSQQQQQRSQQQ